MTVLRSVDELASVILAAAAAHPGQRLVVGIVGPPGAGKSTIAEAVVARLNADVRPRAALLPMDGFHLPQARLVELGRRERMGAPDTFDVDGFLATLAALRAGGAMGAGGAAGSADAANATVTATATATATATVLAPGFDRTIEEAVPGAISIGPDRSIVVVEGNYLLLDQHGWEAARPHLDVSVFVRLARDIRLKRLIDRHVRFGKSPQAARDWALGPDEANARIIDATAERADHIVEL